MSVRSHSPLVFALTRIESLMHQVTFDPLRMTGKIITNTSLVKKEDLEATLDIFSDAMKSGLAVSPVIKIEDNGRYATILTACSLTMDGVLLKRGIPVRPKGGGIIEVIEREPTRFTDMLMYWATTMDPLDVLISQELTGITGMMRTGNGRILGNLQEAPMLARDRIEEVLETLAKAEFAGVLDLGEPNMDVLGISVERDHLGIALVGGSNLVGAAQECGIVVQNESISSLTEISEMKHIEELL
jgi:repressor of nif and glnA expression